MSKIDLKRRVVVVTGASQGLGEALAKGLAGAGARVVIASPDRDNVQRVVRDIGKKQALGVVMDITKPADCKRLLKRTIAAYGKLEVLLNNARNLMDGTHPPFWELSDKFYEATVRVNVYGTFQMSKTVVPHMMKRGWGRIINVTTSLDTIQRKFNSPYGVTKAAEEAATLIWAAELKGSGVTVNSLIPGGACDTRKRREPPAGRSKLLPVDIMNDIAVWLASDHANGHTGERYVGKLWNPKLSVARAAKGCLEPPVFRSPKEAS